MSPILITGANRSIGLELVTQYLADKWDVIACCRDTGKAAALHAMAKNNPALRIEALEATDGTSIAALAARLKDTPIDILINNAGIYSGSAETVSATTGDRTQAFGSIDADAWAKVLRVNTIAPIMVIEALAPLVKKGAGKKIVNITSRMGSLANMGAGAVAYRSSKTALNGAMRVIAHDLRALGLMVVNFHPGWVQTDMGGKTADLTPAQSAANMRQVIATLTPEHSGQFLNYDGHVIPW